MGRADASTTGPVATARAVRRVVLIILVLNLLVAAIKGVYAAWSGSLALASDAIHSVLDASSNVVGMVALHLAGSPPDEEHPYGHRKIEILAAVAIGVVIGIAAFQFAASAIGALWRGTPSPVVTTLGFVVVVATLVVNVFVAIYEHRRGRQLGSAFLTADALHTASDVVVTVTVLLSMLAARAGVTWADPVAALAVTVVIGRVAWRILSENLGILLDRAALPAEGVRAIAVATPGVEGCHRVRSRGVAGAPQLDLHIQVDGALPLAAAHAISHAVEARLKAAFADLRDVTIHVEPEDDEEESI
ncbi:MAG: cation transporter [Deltaproteobacteria bacterium]|nr:cation transporter [Deltaproteobacteria bacterium]